jgi:hypothetical protein
MKNVETPQYSEYRLNDVIGRLEGFRSTVGWGQLNEDIEIAIECMRYVADVIEAETDAAFEDIEFHRLNREIDDILNKHSQGKG